MLLLSGISPRHFIRDFNHHTLHITYFSKTINKEILASIYIFRQSRHFLQHIYNICLFKPSTQDKSIKTHSMAKPIKQTLNLAT